MTGAGTRPSPRRDRLHAALAAALLAVTALLRVPTHLYEASRQDFSEASGEVLVILAGSGLLAFLFLILAVAWLPPRLRALGSTALVGLASYAWVRASFFPGPAVNLDGRRLTTDLSTGLPGLLVPLAAGLLLAFLGRRQPRVVTTFLAVLLGGSLVQSGVSAVSAWRGGPRASGTAAGALLEWSREGNVLVVILDTLQTDVFEEVLGIEAHLREDLDGFRLYRAALSSSPTTYLSLPAIHSGNRYDPSLSAREYFIESIERDSVLNRLADAGYRVSYAMNLQPCPAAVTECLSTPVLARSRREVAFREALELLDLGIYRILPDRLRRTVLGEGRGLLGSAVGEGFPNRTEEELLALRKLAASSTVSDSPPTAKMIHTIVTHPPFFFGSDCSKVERTYDRAGAIAQTRCAFEAVMALLGRLKTEGIYDSTDILLIADHGYGFESRAATGTRDAQFQRMLGAFSPTVLVKSAGARGPLAVSDAPIELGDLATALCSERECSPSKGLGGLAHVDAGRERHVFWYSWRHRYWSLPRIPGLVEYTVRGDLGRPQSWSREAAAYRLGTLLDFRRGRQNSGEYLGFGWGLRRPTFQEMVDPQASLFLRASFDPEREYEMAVRGWLYHSSAEEPARVRVLVNGVPVGELVSERPDPEPRRFRLEVAGTDLARASETVVTFVALPPVAGERPSEPMALQTFVLRPLEKVKSTAAEGSSLAP